MLKTLIEKRAALLARCKAIEDLAQSENRQMTDTERTEYRAALDESKALKPQIVELQEAEQERSDNAAALASAPAGETREQIQKRNGAPSTGVTVHDNAEDQPFRSFGHMLQMVRACADSGAEVPPQLRTLDVRSAQVRAAAGLNENIGSEGGFLVGQDVAPDLYKNMVQESQVWNRARNFTISSNANGIKFNGIDETSRANGSRWGGVRVYLADEATEATASKPKFGKIEMSLKKLLGLCYITDEQLEDAGITESVTRQAFAEEFAFKLDDLAFRGTGAGAPQGILNADCTVSVAKESSQTAATIVYENVSKMRVRMPARSFAKAVWFVNIDCFPSLEKMVIPHKNVAGTENVSGQAVWIPPNGAAGFPNGSIFGRPVIPIEHCETLGTVGDIVLADMGMYYTLSKGGLQQATSMHVKFLTGEQAFRWTLRIDGQPALKSALTPFKGSGTLSPFVTLATRA
jgi:HK97 family phage major capsid protein